MAILLLMTAVVYAPLAPAGDPPPPPTLTGQTFSISFLFEKGKPHDKLAFGPDGASCAALIATLKVTYKYSGKNSKVVDFTGKTTDAKGTVTELTGSVTGTDIHGTITTTAKDDDPVARNFSGTKLPGN